MTTAQYMLGRKKYQRPQGMLWSNNPGEIQTINEGTENEESFYVPSGSEIGSSATTGLLTNQFITLSDDNRSPMDFSFERIEKRERMINGRMRSYHIADKLRITISWNMLPSRAFSLNPNFDEATGNSQLSGNFGKPTQPDQQYTTDGGAGGVEMLDWYEKHNGPFYVFLAYDKYTNFGGSLSNDRYSQLNKYNQIVEMYFADFSYSVQKRGGSNYDFWNITVTLEEV